MLSACATPFGPNAIINGPISTGWVQMDEQELQAYCKARQERTILQTGRTPKRDLLATPLPVKPVNACYDFIGGVCWKITRKGDPQSERFQQTFGHEALHCYLGLYH